MAEDERYRLDWSLEQLENDVAKSKKKRQNNDEIVKDIERLGYNITDEERFKKKYCETKNLSFKRTGYER